MASRILLSLVLFKVAIGLTVIGIGDSISTGFNANAFNITTNPNTMSFVPSVADPTCGINNPGRAWGAVKDDTFGGIISYAERVNANLVANLATTGATMLSNFNTQSTAAAAFIAASKNQGPYQVLVFLGHGDMCSSEPNKEATCTSTDLNGTNYCRTTPAAFEREFRKGLDRLIVSNNTQVVVLAPLRYSQICNFGTKGDVSESTIYGPADQCQAFWNRAIDDKLVFGFGPCASLTQDCSPDRIQDAFDTQVSYLNVLRDVVAEYAALPAGGRSTTGAVKGGMVNVTLNENAWNYQMVREDISACDCFNPGRGFQEIMSTFVADFVCSPSTCCDERFPSTCVNPDTIPSSGSLIYPSLLLVLVTVFMRFF